MELPRSSLCAVTHPRQQETGRQKAWWVARGCCGCYAYPRVRGEKGSPDLDLTSGWGNLSAPGTTTQSCFPGQPPRQLGWGCPSPDLTLRWSSTGRGVCSCRHPGCLI